MDAVHHVEHVNQVDQPKDLRLIACPHLAIEHGRIDRYVPAGATVAEHLRAIGWRLEGLHARVFIDGEFIEQAQWEYAVPRAGQSCVARVIPMGGPGGGKEVIRIVAMIALVVTAIATQQYWAAGLAAYIGVSLQVATQIGVAAVTLAGTLAMQARMPPARPRLRDQRLVQHG